MIHPDELFFNVTKGPGKFDLMVSLFDGNMNTPRNVEFQLEGARESIMVAIRKVQQEDGSGESWNISGSLMGYHSNRFSFSGHYSTSTRTGYIKFDVPSHKVMRGSDSVEVVTPSDQQAVLRFLAHLRPHGHPAQRR